jgi:hypothetical protein
MPVRFMAGAAGSLPRLDMKADNPAMHVKDLTAPSGGFVI